MKSFLLDSHVVLLCVFSLRNCFSYVCAFAPPQPRRGQGFQLPLMASPKQSATNGSFKNFAKISTVGSREFAYLVTISVGNQDFMVTLDTASSDLWVASSNCTDSDCLSVETYTASPSLSLTHTPFKLNYVLGSVSGTTAYERVTLGQVEIHHQVIGIVTSVSNIILSAVGNSGILGLAFPKSSAIRRTAGKTLLENLFDGLDKTNWFFAYHLGRSGTPSSFTIGEVDSSILSNASLSYFPVYPTTTFENSYDYWKLPLHHISIAGNRLPFLTTRSRVKGSPSPIAVLDTGTSLILGPVREVDALWHSVGGASRDAQSGMWMVRCDRAISASFSFGGIDAVYIQEYFVHPEDMNWNGTRRGNLCLAGIQGNDKVISGDWLLGDTFLRNVYATHHMATTTSPPMIGLANLIDPKAAEVAFHAERGRDTSNPIVFVSRAARPQAPLFLLSTGIGFGSGLLATLALRPKIRRGFLRRRMIHWTVRN